VEEENWGDFHIQNVPSLPSSLLLPPTSFWNFYWACIGLFHSQLHII
jgi:hypothetical protein